MSEYQLAKRIIELSEAKTWDHAKLEWKLAGISESDEPETCLCGHFPIKEICSLRNKLNGKTADVGNCCVNKFLGLSSNKLFQCLKRVRLDPSRPFNSEIIALCHSKGFITDWEREFYIDTWRKRKPTEKQLQKRTQINAKILKSF